MGDRFCIPGSSQTHIMLLAVEMVGSKSFAPWQNARHAHEVRRL